MVITSLLVLAVDEVRLGLLARVVVDRAELVHSRWCAAERPQVLQVDGEL